MRPGVAALAVLVASAGFVESASPAWSEACSPDKERYESKEASYAMARLGAASIWPLATGKGVTVAVVDSGVAAGNKHLAGAVKPGASFVPGDSDPTGRTDEFAHGTAVAGLIAARQVEGSNVVGLAPNSEILPVRAYVALETASQKLPSTMLPSTQQMAQSIRWAADQGVGVINVSMSTRVDDPELRGAVEYAVSKNIVVVASAGNRTAEKEVDGLRYPAALPGVIGVAATGLYDEVTEFSIHGDHVDVAAPGQAILTTYLAAGDCKIGVDKAYASYATGYVSALAALLRERYPAASAQEISYRIMAGAARGADARDDRAGHGLIQPMESLTFTLAAGADLSVADGSVKEDRTVAVDVAAASADPMRSARTQLAAWGIGAGGVLLLALVGRPLIRRWVRG